MFGPPDSPNYPQIWWTSFAGGYGREKYAHWANLYSIELLGAKIRSLEKLIAGRNTAPSAEEAGLLLEQLKLIYEGKSNRDYPQPSWDCVMTGASGVPNLTSGILTECYPHCREEMREKCVKPLSGLWQTLFDAGRKYVAASESGRSESELKSAQTEVFGGIKAVSDKAKDLLPKDSRAMEQINWAIRMDVLFADRERMFSRWTNGMVEGLEPIVIDFARTQFKKGIIKQKDGVDKAIKDLPEQILPLLRCDVEKVIPKPIFADKIHIASAPFKSYKSPVSGQWRAPTEEDRKVEMAEMEKVISRWGAEGRKYAQARRPIVTVQFHQAVENLLEETLSRMLSGNLLFRQMDRFVEGVDYADHVQEKLTAREMAMKGRGQDLARLTADGVPDTSVAMTALVLGASKGHGANLEPVPTLLRPAFINPVEEFEYALRSTQEALFNVSMGSARQVFMFSAPRERLFCSTWDSFPCQVQLKSLQDGQTLFTGTMEYEHNVGSDLKAGDRIPVPTSIQSEVIYKTGMYEIACQRHPWQRSLLVVADNPYVAAIGPSGSATMQEVPVGQWTLEVWHPEYRPARTMSYPVEIKKDQTTELAVEIVPPASLKSQTAAGK